MAGGRQIFTSDGFFLAPAGVSSVNVLLVGGGGGGGRAGSAGGGGGAGQVRYQVGVAVTPGTPVLVTVGAGGAGRSGTTGAGTAGASSAFGALTAAGGGGGGGGGSAPATSGASGGGGQAAASGTRTGGIGTAGNKGGDGVNDTAQSGGSTRAAAGGGGGAGSAGASGAFTVAGNAGTATGGAGGPGLDYSTTLGTDVGQTGWFGGGGGAGTQHQSTVTGTAGPGGHGGGGDGRPGSVATPAAPGTPGTGGGGGGGAGSLPENTTTDGGNGGSGIVIVTWAGWTPPTPPPAPTPIPGASTAALTGPADRWVKAVMKPLWRAAQAWAAILPTATGHRLFADLAAPAPGPVIDARQGARLDIAHHAGTTYVLRAHSTSTLFSSYDPDWAPIVTSSTVPLTSTDLDASPMVLHRSPNGYLWVALAAGGVVRVTRSIDGGATWSTPTTVRTLTAATALVGLVSVGTDVLAFITENDGGGRRVQRIAQASTSIAATSWTAETLPALPAGATSDDHLAIVTAPDGRVLAVSKTTNNDTAVLLLYLLVRSPDATWTAHPIEIAPDDSSGLTRPGVTVLGDGTILTDYGQVNVAPNSLYSRTSHLTTPGAWSARIELLTGPEYGDSAVLPRPADIARAGELFPILAHDRSTDQIMIIWTPTKNPPPIVSTGLRLVVDGTLVPLTWYQVVNGALVPYTWALAQDGVAVPLL